MLTQLPTVNDVAPADGLFPGRWWHANGDRVICTLCPRECSLKDGDRGFCFVRQNLGGEMMLTTYGRSTGFCIDPIEKKPLNHFLPGTSVLSFGTAGCNLGCKFCQNWDISKAREVERLSHRAMPDEIAHAAKSLGCASVAYTYNDPVIWAEYAIDTAKACRAAGVKSVAVTAGYITPEARGPFYEYMDAANVDLKAFTEEFYHKITYSHMQPVLDTLTWLKHETPVWFEITNLIIPDANDRPDELQQMCDWILNAVGDDVPVHFTAFHPDFRMTDRPNTPHETLVTAREIAIKTGLKYAYVGNVNDVARQSTYCPGCGKLVIERNWYELGVYALSGNRCEHCGTTVAGHFENRPGTWGRKRQPVDMRQFHIPRATTNHANLNLAGATMSTDGSSGKREVIDESALAWLANQQQPAAPAPVAKPAANEPPQRLPLSKEQRDGIFTASAEFVKAAVEQRAARIPDLEALGVASAAISGAFISLKRDKRLRSCMGSFGQTMPLLQTISDAAHRTATSDPRFPPIAANEVPFLDLEVWLLFAPERVNAVGLDRINEVKIGTHGLQIIRGNQRGLLLPGVATDNDWDSETFLNQVCIKAGLPPTAWKEPDTTLFRFEGNVTHGRLTNSDAEANAYTQPRWLLTAEQLEELRRTCEENVVALIRGATPMYYCGGVPDETINGISLTVTLPGSGQEIPQVRMSLRDPMPMQSSAFAMCEDLANSLRRRGFLNGKFRLDLSIAYEPVMQGSVDQPSLGGINPEWRCVMVAERGRTGWVYDQSKSPTELLQEAAENCRVLEPAYAQVTSLGFQSTRPREVYSAIPKPQRGPTNREPAVAGRFYPGDADGVHGSLGRMLAGDAPREACRAAMVPHAGWLFSGKLAADVLKRIELPKRIIIIGPKHTPHGSEWAVAPHHTWLLPGRNVSSDVELAQKLSERIQGLEMDATAHQQEHGIEVELPIIAKLSPESRVVGIVVGAANLSRCDQFAEGLASVIRELDEPPLLLISSDMNHYATEEENRRLDKLALEAFDRLDEDALFKTCRENHISMCGMLPAVIVLKTLKKLGGVSESRDIGYATSAAVTKDYNKVVGYAGRILN